MSVAGVRSNCVFAESHMWRTPACLVTAPFRCFHGLRQKELSRQLQPSISTRKQLRRHDAVKATAAQCSSNCDPNCVHGITSAQRERTRLSTSR